MLPKTPGHEQLIPFKECEWVGFDVYHFHSELMPSQMVDWYRTEYGPSVLEHDRSSIFIALGVKRAELRFCDARDPEEIDDLTSYLATRSVLHGLLPTTRTVAMIFLPK
jgi:hypothetical protein